MPCQDVTQVFDEITALDLQGRDVDGDAAALQIAVAPLAQLCTHQFQYAFAQGNDQAGALGQGNELSR
ncbi:hypothetical protein D3C76_1007110 [compost metagenome]